MTTLFVFKKGEDERFLRLDKCIKLVCKLSKCHCSILLVTRHNKLPFSFAARHLLSGPRSNIIFFICSSRFSLHFSVTTCIHAFLIFLVESNTGKMVCSPESDAPSELQTFDEGPSDKQGLSGVTL